MNQSQPQPQPHPDPSNPIPPKPSSLSDHTDPVSNRRSDDYSPYPKLDPSDVAPPPAEDWTTVPMGANPPPPAPEPKNDARAPIYEGNATTLPTEANPYVSAAPAPGGPSTKSESFQCPRCEYLLSVWKLNENSYSIDVRVWSVIRYDGVHEGDAWEMGKEGSGGNQEGRGSCWEYVATL